VNVQGVRKPACSGAISVSESKRKQKRNQATGACKQTESLTKL